MKNYDYYLAQLPLSTLASISRFNQDIVIKEIKKHALFISFDDDSSTNVAYFKINDSEACAVIINFKYKDNSRIGEKNSILLEEKIHTYTLRMVYLLLSSTSNYVYIPETVWSIYGAENWTNQYWPPFVFENGINPRWMKGKGSQYFKFIEFDSDKQIYWLCSADGEDVIYGVCDGNIDSKLDGVKTIHCIRQLHRGSDSVKKMSLSIPASVEKIKKIEGNFTEVTFEGVLPELCEESLKEVKFNLAKVLTPFDMSAKKSVDILLGDRLKEKILFAAHSLTQKVPANKGYIALTNARYDCDGQTILVNTPWIATICPKSYSRSDGEVKGSVVMIGLKDGRQEFGVAYDVYESPEVIEGKIVNAQL